MGENLGILRPEEYRSRWGARASKPQEPGLFQSDGPADSAKRPTTYQWLMADLQNAFDAMKSRCAQSTSVRSDVSRLEIERTLKRYGADAFGYAEQDGRVGIMFRAKGRHIMPQIESAYSTGKMPPLLPCYGNA